MTTNVNSVVLAGALAVASAMACASTAAPEASNSGDGGADGGSAPDGAPNLLGGGDAAARSLDVEPQKATLTVSTPGAAQAFTATVSGSTNPVPAAWTVNAPAVGSIDSTGVFSASGAVGGLVTVQAQVGAITGTATLQVVLQLQDNPGNVAVATQQQLLGGGTADSGFAWLYPYDQTVFPRGLLPPTLQFAGNAPDAVYVHVSFGSLDYKGFYSASDPGQVTLDPKLWTTITETASGTDSVKVELTKISGGNVTGPITESWVIAQGSLKGTVYYESRYSSPTDEGATMRIKPGAAQPDIMLGNCNVCHYVSADGSTIVATSYVGNGRGATDVGGAYNLTSNASLVSQQQGDTYTFGALYKDGSLLMQCASPVAGIAETETSHLYDVKTGAPIAAPGWDGVVENAIMPSFSPDGKRIAFNHQDTGMGHTLAFMDFDVTTKTFSNLADFASDPNAFLSWPSFTPDGGWVVYADGNRSDFATWSAVFAGSGADAKADLRIAHLGSLTTAPLDAINGIRNGKYYLPFGEQAEGHMNYDPTILPVAVGGYYWVVFTSRREYGNTINTADPYYDTDNRTAGALPWRKKLWVAALDVAGGNTAHDISHPAFYLPGQDLQTGNYRGFWALDPCQANGSTCQSGDQCCTGFCRSSADGGSTLTCVPPQGCANEYEKCVTSADCCQSGQGFQCLNGFCAQPTR